MKPLTPEDAQLAEAVYMALLRACRQLNFFELSQLRAAYNGATHFNQLSDSVQRKLADIGYAAQGRR